MAIKFESILALRQLFKYVAVGLVLMMPAISYSQSIILERKGFRNEPIQMEDLKVQARAVAWRDMLGNDKSDVEWLNGFSFNIRNTANKNVISMTVVLMFEHEHNGGPLMVFPIIKGFEDMKDKKADSVQSQLAINLRTNETLHIKISDAMHKNLISFLKEKLPDPLVINSVNLMVERIIYDDDTAYIGGTKMKRDPDKRDRWINEQYFDQVKKMSQLELKKTGEIKPDNSLMSIYKNIKLVETSPNKTSLKSSSYKPPLQPGFFLKSNSKILSQTNLIDRPTPLALSITSPPALFNCVQVITSFGDSCGYHLFSECWSNQFVFYPGGTTNIISSYRRCGNAGIGECWMSAEHWQIFGECLIVDKKENNPMLKGVGALTHFSH